MLLPLTVALVLAVLLWVGVRLLLAGHQLSRLTDDSAGVPVAPSGSVAATVDDRLQRTRSAVETLVMPEVDPAELHPSPGALGHRAQTYVVLGSGLLAVAASLMGGFLLLM